MCKSKKNNANTKALRKISKIISNPEYFKILISNRSINYRKPLYEKLNKIFPPGKTDSAWKNYFLYPEKIPENGREQYIKVMEELLNLQLQIMGSDLKKDAIIVGNKLNEINAVLKKIKKFKSLYHEQK